MARVAAALTTVAALTAMGPAAHADTTTILVGKVVATDGTPLSGVIVVARYLDTRGYEHVRTKADGTYRLKVSSVGDGKSVCAGGWISQSLPRDDDDFEGTPPTAKERRYNQACMTIPVTGTARTEVDLSLSRRGTISGRVTDIDGRPVKNALVAGCREAVFSNGQRTYLDALDSARTTADGSYTLEMPETRGTVKVSKQGFNDIYYGTNRCSALYGPPPVIEMSGDTDLTDIDVVLSRPGSGATSLAPAWVAGTPRVGWTLTADPGVWNPADVSISYAWRRDDEPEELALGRDRTFTPSTYELGATLLLDVTASAPGREPVVQTVIIKGTVKPRRP